MKIRKWFERAGITAVGVLVAAGVIYHLVLRGWCLTWGTTSAEAHAVLPGDELFPVFEGEATHAITINVPAERVWPWLMQIGQDRSGFYSYVFLENTIGAAMPKVERLASEWKPRAVADTVWFGTPKRFGGQARMIAAVVQSPRSFVMVTPTDWLKLQAGGRAQEASWELHT